MATLTASSLAKIRRGVTEDQVVDFDRTIINAALQAIEDRIESSKSVIANDIDTATAPYVFSANMKKRLVAFYFLEKFTLEGVI